MNILTAKGELAAMLHGTNINQVQNPLGVLNRAARALQNDLDLMECKITQDLAPIFKGVFSYLAPTGLKGTKIIDIRPKTNRRNNIYTNKFGQFFDINKGKWSDLINVRHNKFIKTLQISGLDLPEPIVINTLSDTTDLTITPTNISNIQKDIVNYVETSSIKFDLDVAATASLEITDFDAIDLSSTENQATMFLWVYLNSPTAFNSITLRWGNDNANYFEKTVTTSQDGSFKQGWNLIAFDWDTATETGIVDETSIEYALITFNYATLNVISDIRVNVLNCAVGQVLEAEYYSDRTFRDAITGEFKETVTSDDDLINLEIEGLNLFMYKAASIAVQQALGQDATFDVNYFEGDYQKMLAKYKATYKSEIQKVSNPYYKVRKGFTGRIISNQR